MKMKINSKQLLNKTVLSIFIILLSFWCISARQKESEPNIAHPDYENVTGNANLELKESSTPKTENAQEKGLAEVEHQQPETSLNTVETLRKTAIFERMATDAKVKFFTGKKEFSQKDPIQGEKGEKEEKEGKEGKERFHWKPALIQSGIFLGIQHGFRMTQAKTRRELNGPFFRDWGESVKGLRGWKDQDNFFTNYIAHPLQGGLTGRIFINNSDRAKNLEFGKSKKYWESRLKAMAWSAVWSTQFELGPISEASIGNVGIRYKNGGPTMAWGDLIVTPTLGTGVVILEDALDKYVLKNWLEKKTGNKFVIKMFRIIFTPTTGVANVLRVKRPSWREYRPL